MDNNMDIRQTFAQRLRGLREAAGLTQKELAERLKYSRGSISYYENCDRVPDIEFLMTASEFFCVTPHFLLGYSENKSQSNEDIGFRLGLSDKAIDILYNMDLCDYREFISAFIEHSLFPKLFDCINLYLDGFSSDKLSLNAKLDEHEFRHFQITRMIVAILDDMQKEFIVCDKPISTLDHVDEGKRFQFYKEMLHQRNIYATRIMEEYETELKAKRERLERSIQEYFEEWENSIEGQAVKAAQAYVETVTSSSKNDD